MQPSAAASALLSWAAFPALHCAVKYLAGWGVVLSRDLATHAVSKANLFQRRPELAPAWFG